MQPLLSSSGFRDGLGERHLVFDHESGTICERLLLRSELSAYETAIRRRIGRLASIQAPELVPVIGVERDLATHRLAVVSKHASGVRLRELLRGARDREIVPDMGASIYVAAQLLQATHAFHSLTGLPHGILNPHHIIVSADGDLQITDYAFAEVIEATNFSRERLWRELHIAAWMGSDVFSFQADVRHAALIAIAMMVGRPLESDELRTTIDSLLSEVEEAAMIRGGRLFADPVRAWLVKALGAGSSEGYPDAGTASDACAALLTDRERSEAARALPPLIEAITESLPEDAPGQHSAATLASTLETEIAEIEVQAAATGADPDSASAFAAWPSSAIGDSEPWSTETSETEALPQGNLHEVAAVTEVIAFPDATTIDPEAPSAIVEPAFEDRYEDVASLATEPAHRDEPAEEPAQAAPSSEPTDVSGEPERRGKKRKKRHGKRGSGPEAPAAEPTPAAPVAPPVISTAHPPEPIPHTPWVPATASSPTVEQSREISSASPFSILDRQGAAAAIPSQSPQIERGSPQYFPPGVIDTNISQPQGPPQVPPPAAPPQLPQPPAIEAPQVIRLKSAVGQPEPAGPIRLKSREEPTGIRLKEQPVPAKPRSVPPVVESYEPEPESGESERKIPRHLWKYVAAAVAVLIAGIAAVTVKFTSGVKNVPPGTLVIETIPVGSQVFVDGEDKGQTPATMELLPGRHEVKLTRKNASHSWTVEVTAGARRVERLDWAALFSTGGVEIVSNNPGARVFVDGKPRGAVPITITDLTPGRHLILVQSPSGNVRRTVTIVAGETTRLDLAIYSGWLVVGSPIELDVAENGKVIGQAGQGPLVLPAGRHRIDLVNQTYAYRSSHEVEIRPGEEERIVENPSGVLNVNATPWAEVWVDGTRAGETPLANVKVPLGTREVLFKHPQFGERRLTVTVTAKETVQLAIDMTKLQ